MVGFVFHSGRQTGLLAGIMRDVSTMPAVRSSFLCLLFTHGCKQTDLRWNVEERSLVFLRNVLCQTRGYPPPPPPHWIPKFHTAMTLGLCQLWSCNYRLEIEHELLGIHQRLQTSGDAFQDQQTWHTTILVECSLSVWNIHGSSCLKNIKRLFWWHVGGLWIFVSRCFALEEEWALTRPTMWSAERVEATQSRFFSVQTL